MKFFAQQKKRKHFQQEKNLHIFIVIIRVFRYNIAYRKSVILPYGLNDAGLFGKGDDWYEDKHYYYHWT